MNQRISRAQLDTKERGQKRGKEARLRNERTSIEASDHSPRMLEEVMML